MAVKIISRTFDPAAAVEYLVFEDGHGTQHHLPIHIAKPVGPCKECGRAPVAEVDGSIDVEAEIAAHQKELETREKAIRAYMRKRPK